MEALLNPATFEFFLKYVVAGFVLLSARASLVTGEMPKPNETIVEAVILSLINQLVWRVGTSWVATWLPFLASEVFLFSEVVVQPILLG